MIFAGLFLLLCPRHAWFHSTLLLSPFDPCRIVAGIIIIIIIIIIIVVVVVVVTVLDAVVARHTDVELDDVWRGFEATDGGRCVGAKRGDSGHGLGEVHAAEALT